MNFTQLVDYKRKNHEKIEDTLFQILWQTFGGPNSFERGMLDFKYENEDPRAFGIHCCNSKKCLRTKFYIGFDYSMQEYDIRRKKFLKLCQDNGYNVELDDPQKMDLDTICWIYVKDIVA